MPSFLASFPDLLALGPVLLLTGERRPETEREKQVCRGSWHGEGSKAEGWGIRTGKMVWNKKERKAKQRAFFPTLGLLVI